MDCSAESPKGRRSVCYDQEALESRKKHKPENSAINMATYMGIELLTEEQYRELQKLGNFDIKTSSWVQTPTDIRELGGALFVIFASVTSLCIIMERTLTMLLEDFVDHLGYNLLGIWKRERSVEILVFFKKILKIYWDLLKYLL